MTFIGAGLLVFVMMGAGAQPKPPMPSDVEALDWGKTPHVSRLGNLFFAGQVDVAGLERAQGQGVEVVINLRAPSEFAWDEQSAVEALGLEYFSVPVASPFDAAVFAQINQLVDRFEGKRVLVHCASSNRVGAWLATRLVEEHSMDLGLAIEIGKRAGISRAAVEGAVEAYVKAQP